jgi:periplasmic protein TonB
MLAYAAGRPRIGERHSSPHTMLFIISAHIAAVAVLMSAKMDLPARISNNPIVVRFIHEPPPPPPNDANARQTQQQTHTTAITPRTHVTTREPVLEVPDTTPLPVPGPSDPIPMPPPQSDFHPTPVPVSTPAQPLTAASDLKPPYPESKLLAGEEASLTLRLTVDEHGRVVAVDPIGPADAVFLSAARKHLMARWRYKPAMQDGRAVSSTLVVTLRFELDDCAIDGWRLRAARLIFRACPFFPSLPAPPERFATCSHSCASAAVNRSSAPLSRCW